MTNKEPCLSLQGLSLLAAATGIWSTSPVINRIKNFFDIHAPTYKKAPRTKNDAESSHHDWENIEKYAVDQIRADFLPPALKKNLLFTIKSVSQRIYYFLESTGVKLICHGRPEKFHENIEYYIENIRWTPVGTIDAVGIFRQRYQDETIENDYFMWYESCTYCLEDCIRELWSQMSDEGKEKTVSKIDGDISQEFVMVAYWYRHIQGTVNLRQVRRWRDDLWWLRHQFPNDSVSSHMMVISTIVGLSEAVKYFWRQLDNEQKNNHLYEVLGILDTEDRETFYLSFYAKPYSEVYSDILGFIIEELTDDQIQLFASRSCCQLLALVEWPWQNLFLQTLDKIWDELGDSAYRKLIQRLVLMVSEEKTMKWWDRYRDVLVYMWRKLPIRFKENTNRKNMSFLGPLAANNVKLVHMILDDPHIHLTSVDFLRSSKSYWESFISKGDYEALDESVRRVCRSDSEIVEWLSEFDNESICISLLKDRKCDEADKFLYWRFGGDLREIRRFKDVFIFYNDNQYFTVFIRSTWIKMWNRDRINCKEAVMSYIKWFTDYDSEKMTVESFKNNEPMFKIFMNNCEIFRFDVFEIIFLCYSLTDKEVQVLKNGIFREFVLNIYRGLTTAAYAYKVKINFNWACNNLDKKYAFVRDFLASKDAKNYFTTIATVSMRKSNVKYFFEEITRIWFEVLSREEVSDFVKKLKNFWEEQNFSDASFRKFDLFLRYLDNVGTE